MQEGLKGTEMTRNLIEDEINSGSFDMPKKSGAAGRPSPVPARMFSHNVDIAGVVIRALLGAILFATFSLAANATCPTYHTLTNGTTADATQVMDNFEHILGCPNFTGNVGVGTASPTQALHVVGNIYATGDITCGGSCGEGSGGGTSQWTTTGSDIYYNAGRVGIGTTTPSQKLEVSGTNNLLALRATSGYVGYVLYSGAAEVGDFGYAASAGQFGNGAAAGDTVLTNIGSSSKLDFATGPTPTVRMVVDASGNVGIGTTTPSYTLHVNGTAYATGAAGALSDVRDKTHITPIFLSALDVIGNLRPVSFYWKAPKDDGMKGQQIGLIAQEVEKVLPSAILTANDARKSKAIKYNELTAVLIKAVQEQQSEIQKLRQANEKLEARMARLERARVAKAN